MDGREIKRLRERRGLTQEQLAEAIKVGPRTIGNWESNNTVPKNRAGMLEKFFEDELRAGSDDPIKAASDVALLAELLRRATFRTVANG